MRLRLRMLWLILASFFKKAAVLAEETTLVLRVLPNDVDITKITTDRYSALMDLGRFDNAFRAGLLKVMFRKKWIPVATFQTIRFRYPLKIFQKYQLRSKVIWWDATTFYWEHVFERNGRIVATGHVCATLFDKSGIVPTSKIVDIVGPNVAKPDMPQITSKLRDAESLIHKTQKE